MFKFANEDLKKKYQGVDPGNCAVTDEMKAFDPVEVKIQFGSAAACRMIYYPKDKKFDDKEYEAILGFKKFCKAQGKKIPEIDNEILRMLHKKRMDNQQAYNALMQMQQINKEIMPIKFGPICDKLLLSGFMYVGGRDRHFRPYLVFRPAILLNAAPNPEHAVACIMLTMGFVMKHMMSYGSVENLITIVSQEGVSMWNMSLSLMKHLMRVIASVMAGRARQMFVVNAATIFSMMFKIASNFLDENTINKIQVTTANTSPVLKQLIAPEQLEKRFGGSAANREDGTYWPPRLPAETFGIEDRKVVKSTTGNAA